MIDPIYKNVTAVGELKSPLLLQSSGKVIVKIGGKYYPLDIPKLSKLDINTESTSDIDILILQNKEDINNISLSNNTLIFTLDGSLYINYNNNLQELNLSSSNLSNVDNLIINGTLTLNGELLIADKNLITNLNAELLNGKNSSEFIQINLPTTIDVLWTFSKKVVFENVICNSDYSTYLDFIQSELKTKNIISDNIITSTLQVDNLITNESGVTTVTNTILISDPISIQSVEKISYEDYPAYENGFTGGISLAPTIVLEYNAGNFIGESSISELLNKLLLISTNELFYDSIVITDSDITSNSFLNYYYMPKDLNVWKEVIYKSDTAYNLLYLNWFNIYETDISNHQGNILKLNLEIPLKLYDNFIFEVSNTIYSAIVTYVEESIIHIVTTGINCAKLTKEEYEACTLISYPTTSTKLYKTNCPLIIGNLSNITIPEFKNLPQYGSISRNNYFIDPNIKGKTYSILEDGTVELGSGDTKITISPTGEVKIPQKCIII